MEDVRDFSVAVEPPVKTTVRGIDVYACGPWCQGPVLLQMLGVLDGIDLAALGQNSPAYVHTVVEAMKLAFADRERYYGDPRFADVPIEALLSTAYSMDRRRMIRGDEAWPEMPPAGVAATLGAPQWPDRAPAASVEKPGPSLDTSYVCAVDRHGNAFSATPSDISSDTPVIPGTGLCPSSRGSQSWTDPRHPSCVAPGKRPRLTPNPALAVGDGTLIPFGSPGGDVQAQAMLQALLNIIVFAMDTQEAVEAPRFATYSFPDSFEPHAYHPGRLSLESGIGAASGDRLAARGHTVERWPERTWRAGAVCAIRADRESGVLSAGADPRRPCYAVGW